MSDYKTERCLDHNEVVALVSRSEAERLAVPYGCQGCRQELETRPIPDTPEGRVADLRRTNYENLLAPFDAQWARIDRLVGRSTLTHELAYPEYLEHEILTGLVPSVEGIIAKLPHDMPVIVVNSDG